MRMARDTLRGLSRPGWREIAGTFSSCRLESGREEWLAAGPRRDRTRFPKASSPGEMQSDGAPGG